MQLKVSLFQLFFVAVAILLTTFTAIVPTAKAATLTVQTIGASTVGGQRISSWTYLGSNPVITGTADPSATVTISIDGVTATVTADASGNWSYTPTTLSGEGTHQIVITSGDQTISFTLGVSASTSSGGTTANATMSASTKGGVVEELPVAGGLGETITLLGFGFGLVAVGITGRWVYSEWAVAKG